MEDIRGFSERGNWYKGNLHSHTTNSDGHLTPAESVRMFREHGYSFLAFTDHDRYSDYRTDFDGGDFIIIPGYEASAVLYKDFGLKKRLKVHHVNALLGTSRMVREAREPLPEHLEFLPQRVYFKEWNGAAVLRDMVERMRGMGFIAMYNHPVWSRVSEYEFAARRESSLSKYSTTTQRTKAARLRHDALGRHAARRTARLGRGDRRQPQRRNLRRLLRRLVTVRARS